VTRLSFTPELARNARIQLRHRRLLASAIICAAVSLSALAYYGHSASSDTGDDLLQLVVLLQITVLLLGGGVYCVQSLHGEKELNTFDYQRVTRLKPLDLALGKLLGAPALTYFIVLCLMPMGFWAYFRSTATMSTVLQVYILIFLGSITYHAFALLISLLLKRGTSAGGILFFLLIVGLTSVDYSEGGTFGMHRLSPFFAFDLLTRRQSYGPTTESGPYALYPSRDLFFGVSVPHVLVLVVIYLTLTMWLLLAVARNIKRDPSVYEVYSPTQSFAPLLYLECLLLGFSRWMIPVSESVRGSVARVYFAYRPASPTMAEGTFLSSSLGFFVIFGLALLRNRDRVRRRSRVLGAHAAGWWAAVWPAPYLFIGATMAGIGIVSMIRFKLRPQSEWSTGLGMLEVGFFVLWLARDALYLQWMSLRRTRRPVFYVCASAATVGFGWYDRARAPYRAVLFPSAAFGLDTKAWTGAREPWIGALFLLVCQAFLFVLLQRRELQALLAAPSAISDFSAINQTAASHGTRSEKRG
jgi:hypothetical protein